jgi:putative DNA methylase
LENGLPVRQLNHIAIMQGNSKMPVYQIHKWWARRLGSVFRSLIISAFLKPNSSDFWRNYYNGFLLRDKVIYDPFMGGGTTLIEGLRLGCKVIGNDINPVAWFVTKKEIDPFNTDDADLYFRILEERVGERIRTFYETTCPNGHKADVLYCIWIRQLHCAGCNQDYDLFNNYVIREKPNVKTIVCSRCDDIFKSKEIKGDV